MCPSEKPHSTIANLVQPTTVRIKYSFKYSFKMSRIDKSIQR
jgi:hypothetical protein